MPAFALLSRGDDAIYRLIKRAVEHPDHQKDQRNMDKKRPVGKELDGFEEQQQVHNDRVGRIAKKLAFISKDIRVTCSIFTVKSGEFTVFRSRWPEELSRTRGDLS